MKRVPFRVKVGDGREVVKLSPALIGRTARTTLSSPTAEELVLNSARMTRRTVLRSCEVWRDVIAR